MPAPAADASDQRDTDRQPAQHHPSGGEVTGRVYLVGAGPGDPGLITWRGVQLLRSADLVLYDYLANPDVLQHVPAGVETICLGQHGRIAHWAPEAIHQRMIEGARAGLKVVRLKGGDPGIFGRLADEISALRDAGVPYEVVPGVTAALAAPAFAGIPLTNRSIASAVALVTAHQQDTPGVAPLDYDALACFPGTLVFYMGVTEVEHWTSKLLAAGKPPSTPVAIIRHGSMPQQQTWICTLAELAARVRQLALRPPVIFVCGEVVKHQVRMSWFQDRPLHGRRVLVTRPENQQTELRDILASRGAEVLSWAAIRVGPPASWERLDRAWDRLRAGEFDWVVFSSANGVDAAVDRAWSRGMDHRAFGTARIAAMGPGTQRALERRGLRADCVPAEYHAEALAAALAPDARDCAFLLVRASRGREVLAEMLSAAGGNVEQVVAYASEDAEAPDARIASQMSASEIHWVTVTSSAIARSLARHYGPALRATRLASISPLTSAVLREAGHEVAVEATEATMESLVQAIERAEAERPSVAR